MFLVLIDVIIFVFLFQGRHHSGSGTASDGQDCASGVVEDVNAGEERPDGPTASPTSMLNENFKVILMVFRRC